MLTADENESLVSVVLLTVVISKCAFGRGSKVTSSSTRSKIDGPMATKYGFVKSTTKQLASVSQGFATDMFGLANVQKRSERSVNV